MRYLSIKDWSEMQHYRDRNPPWIKLHNSILNDYDFSCLHDASKLLLMLLWALSSQLNNRIPDDSEWLEKRLPIKGKINLKELIDKGFLIVEHDASKPLSECSPEKRHIEQTETEEEREKINKKNFDEFFTSFPTQRKGNRDKAKSAYLKAIERSPPEAILTGLKSYLRSSEVKQGYAKGAAAWLNDDRWSVDYSITPNTPAQQQPYDNSRRMVL